MKKLRMSLLALMVIASLMLSTVGMAEAKNHKYHKNNHQYSQSYNNHHPNYSHKNHYNNYYRHNKHHRAQYVKNHRARYAKHHRRHNNHNKYLYPVLIGAGVGLLVLGLTR